MSEYRFFPLALPDIAINPAWWLYLFCEEIQNKGIQAVEAAYKTDGGRRALGIRLVNISKERQAEIELEQNIVGYYELNRYAIRQLSKIGKVVSCYGDQKQSKIMFVLQKQGYFELKQEQSNIQFCAKSGNWYILEFQNDLVLYLNHVEQSRKAYYGHDITTAVKNWLEAFDYPIDKHEYIDVMKQYAELYDMFKRGAPNFQCMQSLITLLCNHDIREEAELLGIPFKPIFDGHQFFAGTESKAGDVHLYWRAYYRIANAWAFDLMTKESSGTEPMYIGGLTSFLNQLAYKWKDAWTEDISPKLNLNNETTDTIITLFNDAMKSQKKDVASGRSNHRAVAIIAYLINEYKQYTNGKEI